jgi:hypothetical protein
MSSGRPNPDLKSGVTAGRDQRARDAASALKEYQADRLAMDANTARLRALRLARDAAAARDAAVRPAKQPAKKSKKTSPAGVVDAPRPEVSKEVGKPRRQSPRK